MKRNRLGHSRSPSPELDDARSSGSSSSRGLPIRVPVTPTKTVCIKEFASPLRPRQSFGGGVGAAAAAPASLPPPSPLKTAAAAAAAAAGQRLPERMRAPLSRLQQEGTRGGGSSSHQPALAPAFQSPSKHRYRTASGAGGTTAALNSAVSSPPPKVVTAGGAMRVLTPAKAARSRASLGGAKRPRLSGGDALAHEGDGTLSSSTSSSSSGSGNFAGGGDGGGGIVIDRASSRSNSFGAARRVSTHSSASGRSQEDDDDDDGDDDGDGATYDALLAAELNAGSNSGRDRPPFSAFDSAATAAAVIDRLPPPPSSSSLRVGTALRRVSASRGGNGGEGTRVHQRPASAAAAAAAARRSSSAKDRRSGSSPELAHGGSSWGPPADVLDPEKAPRRVSTWSNNSSASTTSSTTSSTASDLDAADAAGAATGKRGHSLISTPATAATLAKNNAAVAGAGAGRVRQRSSGGGSGPPALSRRVSSGRQLVGATCQRCGGSKAEERGQEGLSCEGCGAEFGADDAESGVRGVGTRARGRRSGVSAMVRRRSAVLLSAADAAASGRGGDSGLSDQDPGRRMSVQDFQVTSSLGQGKFGNVYKAKSRHSNKTVAIKMILKSNLRGGTKQDAVNMSRERTIQAELHHRNIVRLRNYFQDAKFIYLVLDFAAGGDLYKLLEKNKNGLPLAAAAGYLCDALSAVSHLHGVDIMHRDIKAENLLLDGKGRLKLSDFGWAVHARPPLDTRRTMCGTPEYAPPEILVRDPEYTKAVDVWSLGVLAFELLTGQTPFAKPQAITSPSPAEGKPAGADGSSAAARSPDGGPGSSAGGSATAAAAASSAGASVAAEVEAIHRGDIHAKLYGRIAGWEGSRESLFGPGTRGAGVPSPAADVVLSMLRPRPEDRLESGEVLRLPWVASRGKGTDEVPC
eukprot:g15910.t2